ncbi:MAG: hybrid-cluster NAD(P)-dependent oxidoreductase [Sandaracinaceae bacterium]|nr:hybrid-cluster NAD(P)-dependent oxidoreductase [Sandaracinaceae bacterium]
MAKQVPRPPAADLPFAILLFVAGADDEIDAHEVEVFQKLSENRRWCQSPAVSALMEAVDGRYSTLWGQHRRGTFDGSLRALRGRYAALATELPADQRVGARADFARLGWSLARASGGVLGVGRVSKRERAALAVLDALGEEFLPSEAEAARSASDAEEGALDTRVWGGERIHVRCVQTLRETADCTTFRFAPEEPLHFRYAPGQFLCLELDIDGQVARRSYTIASSPSRPDVLELTVKRVPGGVVSNWLCDHMHVGGRLLVTGCAGHFTCANTNAERFLMISAGSGITPVMSMARWLHDRGDPRDVVFVHSARSLSDVIFHDELQLLERRHASFRLAVTLTRDLPPGHEGLRGRVDAALLARVAPDWQQRHIFLCGPEPFMRAVRASVEAAGFPMEHYAAESFGASPERASQVTTRASASALRRMLPAPLGESSAAPELRAPRPVHDAAPVVRAPRKTASVVAFEGCAHAPGDVACDAGMTVLDAAESAGVDIPFACRSGACGTCRVSVRGEVRVPPGIGLGEADREAGFTLACVAHPVGRVVVDV